MPVPLLRSLRPSEITCPAGELVNEADCHCKIEDHLIRGPEEPNTIEGYCAGDHTLCSTWQAAKKVEDHGGDLRKILKAQQEENTRKRSQTALRDARMRRAQRLMVEDSPEGRKFRRALKVGEYAHLAKQVGDGDG